MAVNVRGLFLCMKYEIQQMLTQGAGVIVNTSAIGLIAFPGISPYVASKHAVVGLTRAAALDYARAFGLMRLTGAIATELFARSIDRWASQRMISHLWCQWDA